MNYSSKGTFHEENDGMVASWNGEIDCYLTILWDFSVVQAAGIVGPLSTRIYWGLIPKTKMTKALSALDLK